jgi:hypothetical protein
MNRVALDSSSILGAGYDEATNTMEVEFRGGSVYQYFDVPAATFQGLLQAPSAGRFHAEQVKGVFRYGRT